PTAVSEVLAVVELGHRRRHTPPSPRRRLMRSFLKTTLWFFPFISRLRAAPLSAEVGRTRPHGQWQDTAPWLDLRAPETCSRHRTDELEAPGSRRGGAVRQAGQVARHQLDGIE